MQAYAGQMSMVTRDPPEVPFVENFETFYRREFPAMVTLAYAVSGSRLGAEDLAQEALLRAYRNWDRISRYEKPGAWLRRVTINLATSAIRRRAVEARALIRFASRDGSVPEPDPDDLPIWAALSRLPTKQRAAAYLFYLEDQSTAQIAASLGCSESTARVHLHRARQALIRTMTAVTLREGS